MKITLCSSWKTLHSHPPLGLGYIAAVLRSNDFDVNIIDYEAIKSTRELEEQIIKRQPNVVGISALSTTMTTAKEIAKIAKKCLPDVIVIFGGPHPTVMPEETLKDENIDGVVIGEGEYSFLELIQALSDGKDIKNVKGVFLKEKNGEILRNKPRGPIENLDALPLPARDLLPMDLYLSKIPLFPLIYPETHLIAARGCPYNCSFCQPTEAKLFGRKVRYRQPKNVVAEMALLKKKYKVKCLWVGADTLTADRKWVKSFCNEIKESDLDTPWVCSTRVDVVDKEMLTWMKKANCILINFGVESGSQRILDEVMNKGITIEQIRSAFKWCNEVGVCTGATFMIASPTESKEEIEWTIHLMEDLFPDTISVFITNPIPGTALFTYIKDLGLLKSNNLSQITRHSLGTFQRENLSDNEIVYYMNKMNEEFYKIRSQYPSLLFNMKAHLLKLLYQRMFSLFARKPKNGIVELLRIIYMFLPYFLYRRFHIIIQNKKRIIENLPYV